MRVRILSFQNAHNYGAVLQAYALQQTLRSLGAEDASFINYNPRYLKERYSPFSRTVLKDFFSEGKGVRYGLSFVVYALSVSLRNYRIRYSINHLLAQTPKVFTDACQVADNDCEVLICGSDQIWNPEITKGVDPAMFGVGRYPNLHRLVSYAASTELSSLNDTIVREICGLLSRFDLISVREKPVKDALSRYCSSQIHLCLDPTLICDVASYNAIAKKRVIKKEYVLVYCYNPYSPEIVRVLSEIPGIDRLEVHYALLGPSSGHQLISSRHHGEVDVMTFLSLFKYASYIVTNSFHGLAFSLIFNKNFNVLYEAGKHVRCESLLSALDLNQRMVRIKDTVDWMPPEYGRINNRLRELRQKSVAFLKEALTPEEHV